MKHTTGSQIIYLLIAAGLFFVLMPYLHQGFIKLYNVENEHFVNHFFNFITLASALMVCNLLLVYYIKPQWTGFIFLAWSMLKLMLVMGYFLFFMMPDDIRLSSAEIYEFVSIYMSYLLVEVIFTYFLIQNSDPYRDGN